MQRLRSGMLQVLALHAVRSHATYESVVFDHDKLKQKYTDSGAREADMLGLLEATETIISRWRLNKWEFRIPPLMQTAQREQVMLQRDLLKSCCISHGKQMEAVNGDLALVSEITGVTPEDVRQKNRSWLQEEAAKLRWKGDVNKAKALRDAFLRLEVYGARDHKLLERLSCIYGLGLLGTFDDAFSRTIVADPRTGSLSVNQENPFTQLLSSVVTQFPHIDIVYDFLGFNPSKGYRNSFSRLVTNIFIQKYGDGGAKEGGRILFSHPATEEIFFDFAESRTSITVDDSVYGLPDFLYKKGGDLFMITIASDNHWLRNRQMPHKKQLEGISRRASFVFGIPFDKVRIRNVLLPPGYLDRDSLLRVLDQVIALTPEERDQLVPWLPLYDKELDTADVDFCELQKTVNEDEWLTL